MYSNLKDLFATSMHLNILMQPNPQLTHDRQTSHNTDHKPSTMLYKIYPVWKEVVLDISTSELTPIKWKENTSPMAQGY